MQLRVELARGVLHEVPLDSLVADGVVPNSIVEDAIARYGIDPEIGDPASS